LFACRSFPGKSRTVRLVARAWGGLVVVGSNPISRPVLFEGGAGFPLELPSAGRSRPLRGDQALPAERGPRPSRCSEKRVRPLPPSSASKAMGECGVGGGRQRFVLEGGGFFFSPFDFGGLAWRIRRRGDYTRNGRKEGGRAKVGRLRVTTSEFEGLSAEGRKDLFAVMSVPSKRQCWRRARSSAY